MKLFPSICRTDRLTPDQRQAILLLTEFCRKQDFLSLTYPLSEEEEVLYHYLLTDSQGQLLSVLALLPLDDSTLECIAFTDPRYRRRGFFSRLLSLAMEDCRDPDLLFPVSGHCADTQAVLDALGAELFRQDLQMERDLSLPLSFLCPPADSRRTRACLKIHSCHLLIPDDIFSENALWRLVIPELCRTSPTASYIVGSCRTSPVSRNSLCLHEVEILPSMRGRGLGTVLIWQLLSFLQNGNKKWNEPVGKILLHVSGDNRPAVALYKKTGFRITETLSYYWY